MYNIKKNYTCIMVHVPDLQLESELNVLTMVGTIWRDTFKYKVKSNCSMNDFYLLSVFKSVSSFYWLLSFKNKYISLLSILTVDKGQYISPSMFFICASEMSLQNSYAAF